MDLRTAPGPLPEDKSEAPEPSADAPEVPRGLGVSFSTSQETLQKGYCGDARKESSVKGQLAGWTKGTASLLDCLTLLHYH